MAQTADPQDCVALDVGGRKGQKYLFLWAAAENDFSERP